MMVGSCINRLGSRPNAAWIETRLHRSLGALWAWELGAAGTNQLSCSPIPNKGVITMPRGEKSGNPRMKRHRATRIAEQMRRRGVPRGEAYRVATAMMEREYARVGPRDPRKMAVNEDVRDSRTGQRKTNLSTKQPAVSGARQPRVAQHGSSSKRSSKKTGGGGKASAARKPRTSSDPAMLPNAGKSRPSG